MNINCTICSDLFQPNSHISVTKCGHVFHQLCLLEWIGRSKTCPQCRRLTTDKTINRVFFNIITSDTVTEDPVALQNKLDNVELQLKLKDKDINDMQNRIFETEKELDTLKSRCAEVSDKAAKYKEDIHILKDRVIHYKEKAKNEEILRNEIIKIQEQLVHTRQITTALTGSLDDVKGVLDACQCPKTLSTIVTAMKKELLNMQKQKDAIFSALKRKESELKATRKVCANLTKEIGKLRLKLSEHHECDEQIKNLKRKLADLVDKTSTKALNTSVQRVLHESPAPLPGRSTTAQSDHNMENVESPSIAERVKSIKESDSPYLKLKKSSSQFFLLRPVLGSKLSSTAGHSIFENAVSKPNRTEKQVKPSGDFDGFGGYSREDLFPSSSSRTAAIKRTKSGSLSSSKFKKLARPNKKIDDFLNLSEIE